MGTMANAIASDDKRKAVRGEGGKFIVPPKSPGRPKGSRNKLGEAFLKALHEDFTKHGAEAIVAVRETKPDAYMKVIASILPKEIELGEKTASTLKESRDASVAAFLRAAADDADSVLQRPVGNA